MVALLAPLTVQTANNPAAAGAVRLANAEWITARNAANGADVNLLRLNSSNQIEQGAADSLLGGNLVFGGQSRRILADMSDGGVTTRLFFQSSVTNGITSISSMPNGTAAASQLQMFGGSDVGNSAYMRVRMDSGANKGILEVSKLGTGTYYGLDLQTGGASRLWIDATGGVTFYAKAIGFQDKGSQVFNIMAYGAVADGTTDSTTFIQAAIDAAAASAGSVLVPPGVFVASQLRLKSNVWFRGTGWGSQIKQKASTTGHLFILDSSSVIHAGIQDLSINGNKANQTNANAGIYFQNGVVGDKGHIISNLLVSDTKGTGIWIAEDTRDTGIVNCYIYACDGQGVQIDTTDTYLLAIRISHAGLSGVKITSTAGASRLLGVKVFFSGDIDGVTAGDGFDISGTSQHMQDCHAEDNSRHGFYLHALSRTIAEGCIAGSNAGDAWKLDDVRNSAISAQVHDIGERLQLHTSVVNLVNNSRLNIIKIAFDPAGVNPANQYVQGSPSDNDVHVGPDGGFRALAYTSLTFTAVAATNVLTASAAHGLAVNDPLYFSTTTTLPAPLAINTVYYVKTVPSTTTMTVSATVGGADVDITTTGTGTHTLTTVKPDPYSANYNTLTLTQDTTIANPTYKHQGQKLTFQLTQDATGGRKVFWGNQFSVRKWVPNTAASKANTIDFVYDGTSWIQTGGTNEGFGDPGTLDRNVTSAAFTSLASASDTTVYSVTIPGDLMGTTGVIRCSIGGDVLINTGTPTYTFKIKFGATTIWADTTLAFAAVATRFAWRMEFEIANVNATNVQVLTGKLFMGPQSAATTGTGDLAAVAKIPGNPFYGTAAIDTTAAVALLVTVSPSVNNSASMEITRKLAITEFLA